MVMINLSKKFLLLFFGVLVSIVAISYVLAVWDNSQQVYHDASNVKISISGADYNLQEAINAGLLSGSGSFGTKDCYIGLPGRGTTTYCKDGFYPKATFKQTDNNWDGIGLMCCRTDSSVNDPALPTAEELLDACPWGQGGVSCLDAQTYPAGQYAIKTYGVCENELLSTCNCNSGDTQISKTNNVRTCTVDASQVNVTACTATSPGTNSWSSCCVCSRA
jgi:hypothetical protein